MDRTENPPSRLSRRRLLQGLGRSLTSLGLLTAHAVLQTRTRRAASLHGPAVLGALGAAHLPNPASAGSSPAMRAAEGAPWWQTGVIYQVYPRSFQDTNGDGVGDLPGVIGRLDYLNDGTPDSLGVEAIWLSPFYPSPMADFGYDVADYLGVDPLFGSLADFDRLVREAHARGIRVIVDLVPNHTSDRHPWFLASRSSRRNPKRAWYVWADPKRDGSPPNNWHSSFAGGPSWTLDRPTRQYYLHSFLPEQPDLNWWNPEVRAAIDEVIRFWLDRGADGFRVDVAHRLARDPELRDNPADRGAPRRDEDWPEVHEILRRFRRTVDGYGDRMMMGETYLLDPARVVRYYGEAADELHLAQNFQFLHQPWIAEAFRDAVDRFESLLPRGAWPDYCLNNHDHSRVASRYGDDGNGPARARLAAMMLMTLRGTPILYQGEEIGMADVRIPADQVADVAGRDPERTPMQWDASHAAGFTTGRPWLPTAPDADRVNVAVQRDDPDSILSLYRRLIWYRKSSPALLGGSYQSLASAPAGVFAFVRAAGAERLLVALNFTRDEIEWDAEELATSARLELSTDPGRGEGDVEPRSLAIGPDEGVVLRLGEPSQSAS